MRDCFFFRHFSEIENFIDEPFFLARFEVSRKITGLRVVVKITSDTLTISDALSPIQFIY